MKKPLHQIPEELRKAEAMPGKERRKAINRHFINGQKWAWNPKPKPRPFEQQFSREDQQ